MLSKVKKKESVYLDDLHGHVTLDSVLKYDKLGRLIWEQSVFPSGVINTEAEYEYLDKKLIREKSWNEKGDWSEISHEFNDDSELIKSTTIYSSGGEEYVERVFGDGEVVTSYYNVDGDLYRREELFQDDRDRDVKQLFYDFEEIVEEHEYEYDDKDQIYKKTVYQKDELGEVLTCVFEYRYNKDGDVISEISKNETGDVFFKEYSRYESGLLVETKYTDFSISTEELIIIYEHDRYGRLVKYYEANALGKVITQQVTSYNEDGTVILNHYLSASTAFDQPPVSTATRTEVEYY